MEKMVSAPAIQFKGTGWYVTDYSGKGRQPAESEGASEGTKEDKAPEKKADKKTKDASQTTKTTKSSSPKVPSSD